MDNDMLDLEGLSDDGADAEDSIPSIPRNSLKRQTDAMNEDDEMSDAAEEQAEEHVTGLVLEGGVKPADELDAEDVQQMELGALEDVSKIAKLEGSKRMTEILRVRSHHV
jgi:U4/U6 small nuclear ribonucleoprotein PRP31